MQKTKNNVFFVLFLISFVINAKGQTRYTLVDTINIVIYQNSWQPPNSYNSCTFKWIDYDNDNDLDLLIHNSSPNSAINIYENFGNDSFALSFQYSNYSNFQGTGDFDNDGDIDLLIKSNLNTILKNTLPDSIDYDTTSFYSPNLVSGWVNIYNKRHCDIIDNVSKAGYLFGYYFSETQNPPNYLIRDSLWSNSLYSFFFNQQQYPYTFNYDINNDGYFDFVNGLSININNGIDSINRFHFIQRVSNLNDINTITSISDFNNDGFLDQIGIKTHKNSNNDFIYSTIMKFKNNQNDSLIQISNFLLDTIFNKLTPTLDYNNDGKTDILTTNADSITVIYTNIGNLTFAMDPYINNLGSRFSGCATADYDNDGDMDIAMYQRRFDSIWSPTNYTYKYNTYYYLALYRNDSTPPNTPPTAPQSLWSTMDSTKVIFNWNKASDVETPQATLSYNLMVGSSPKSIDITSPMADTVTGFRRVVELGNAQLNNFYILDKSIFNIGDTVYWSVQTIDNGFSYSPFSQEGSAIIYGRMEAPVFDTICGNDSTMWRSNYYNTTGRYKDSYGLDSAFFLDLKVHPAYLDQQSADICAGTSYSWNGNTYYNSGTYNIQHYTTKGCDSIERLILNVHPGLTVLQNTNLCMGDSVLFGGTYLKSSGVYWDSLQSVYNCDSIIQLTLNIAPTDTTVWQSGDTLFATPQNASFRWWNCDKQQFIYAANQSYYVANQNGHYAVEISSNGCSYLTSCMEVTGLAIAPSENNNLSIRIMPNPNKGVFFLELEAQGKQEYHIQIFDALGKEIYNQTIEFENYKKLKIDLDNQPSGVYQLRVVSEHNTTNRRFIIR